MRIKLANGTDADITMDEAERIANHLKGDKWEHHMNDDGYLDRAKHNIAELVHHEHDIEDEEDGKEILAHCLNLSPKQADLLYEMIEFAIGMAK